MKAAQEAGIESDSICVINGLKPEAMRGNQSALQALCNSLGPCNRVVCRGDAAVIECGPDEDGQKSGFGHVDTVQPMPMLVQLLGQVCRQACKFAVLGHVPHEPVKLGSMAFPYRVYWSVAGQPKIQGRPYWRGVLGGLSEARPEVWMHIGVCAEFVGGDFEDSVRLTGLTVLPPPMAWGPSGAIMVLAFLSGEFSLRFLTSPDDKRTKGVEVQPLDGDNKPFVVSFAPALFDLDQLLMLLNNVRGALSKFLTRPDERAGKECVKSLSHLRQALMDACYETAEKAYSGQLPSASGFFLPQAKYEINDKRDCPVAARLVPHGAGASLERIELGMHEARPKSDTSIKGEGKGRDDQISNYGTISRTQGGKWQCESIPPWLTNLSSVSLQDFEDDLRQLQEKFNLDSAKVHRTYGKTYVELLANNKKIVEDARTELTEGIYQYWAAKITWGETEVLVDAWVPPAAEPADNNNAWIQPDQTQGQMELPKPSKGKGKKGSNESHTGAEQLMKHEDGMAMEGKAKGKKGLHGHADIGMNQSSENQEGKGKGKGKKGNVGTGTVLDMQQADAEASSEWQDHLPGKGKSKGKEAKNIEEDYAQIPAKGKRKGKMGSENKAITVNADPWAVLKNDARDKADDLTWAAPPSIVEAEGNWNLHDQNTQSWSCSSERNDVDQSRLEKMEKLRNALAKARLAEAGCSTNESIRSETHAEDAGSDTLQRRLNARLENSLLEVRPDLGTENIEHFSGNMVWVNS
eukprot:gnl/MRDRNA2_/MRDRNA2_83077_c0_seq4.p1 gnl/MRDRNA2_/MRDRNA2_83077_c0~~gnl/MRDRNA2_/MRDRNA2_83077_c0_seq4.p1  ORF type:complete len:757 (+),score=139.96 gnl/MRDRNA2_/MRDRNA2_83077_c0_seq4:26-2272(+)